MPIYEYRCESCNAAFEKLVRRAEDSAAVECPSCGEKRVKQQLSVFAAHSGTAKESKAPAMCPSGGVCPTPGACGLN